MPASTTLALGTSSYQLLDAFDAVEQINSIKVVRSGNATTNSASVTSLNGKTIENFGIGGLGWSDGTVANNSLNVSGNFENFSADLAAGNDTLNIVGNLSGAFIELDDSSSASSGNDRLQISKNLTSTSPSSPEQRNQIFTGAGNDTIQIGGLLEDTNMYLGSGNDSLVVSGDANRIYVGSDAKSGFDTAADGRDYLEFRGMVTDAVIQTGGGNDTVVFRKQFYGQSNQDISDFDPLASVSAIDLGSGNDSLTLSAGASNARISTGSGSDTLHFSGSFDNLAVNLGGDKVELTGTAGSSFTNVDFSSASADGDTLMVGAGFVFSETNFYLGSGDDSLVFGSGSLFNDVVFSTGDGADTLVFGTSTMFGNTYINLSDPSSGTDVVSFAEYDFIDLVTVAGGTSDILYIGSNKYVYGGPGAVSLEDDYTGQFGSPSSGWMGSWIKSV